MRWLLVLLLASHAAAAPLPTIESTFPPAIRVGGELMLKPAVTSVKIENGEVTWVTIVVGSDRYQHERDLTLDVPAGMRLVGMAVDDGGGPLWAERRPRWAAAADYYHGQTPTLVEAAGSSSGEDHLIVRISDGGTFELALCASCDGVDDDTSLFLETNRPHRGVIIDRFPSASMSLPELDKAIIRRVVQFQLPQLRRCLMLVGQRDRVDGNVQLDFLIRDDGTTSDTTIETAPQLESARDCLAGVVATLTFPATAAATEVHYPIAFRLDR
jgi:hypothetical protein